MLSYRTFQKTSINVNKSKFWMICIFIKHHDTQLITIDKSVTMDSTFTTNHESKEEEIVNLTRKRQSQQSLVGLLSMQHRRIVALESEMREFRTVNVSNASTMDEENEVVSNKDKRIRALENALRKQNECNQECLRSINQLKRKIVVQKEEINAMNALNQKLKTECQQREEEQLQIEESKYHLVQKRKIEDLQKVMHSLLIINERKLKIESIKRNMDKIIKAIKYENDSETTDSAQIQGDEGIEDILGEFLEKPNI